MVWSQHEFCSQGETMIYVMQHSWLLLKAKKWKPYDNGTKLSSHTKEQTFQKLLSRQVLLKANAIMCWNQALMNV